MSASRADLMKNLSWFSSLISLTLLTISILSLSNFRIFSSILSIFWRQFCKDSIYLLVLLAFCIKKCYYLYMVKNFKTK